MKLLRGRNEIDGFFSETIGQSLEIDGFLRQYLYQGLDGPLDDQGHPWVCGVVAQNRRALLDISLESFQIQR